MFPNYGHAIAAPPHRCSKSFIVMNYHSRHFLALSLLTPFFASFSLSVAFSYTPFHSQSFLLSILPHLPRHYSLSLSVSDVLFFVFIVLFILAACSFSHSALRTFYDKPIKLFSSLRSTASSFLHVVGTLFVFLSPFLVLVAMLFLSDFLLHDRPFSPHLAALAIATSVVALAIIVAYSQIT